MDYCFSRILEAHYLILTLKGTNSLYVFQSFHHIQTASSLSFSSGLVKRVHARASGETRAEAREEKELSLPSRAISHARGHLRVSRFA